MYCEMLAVENEQDELAGAIMKELFGRSLVSCGLLLAVCRVPMSFDTLTHYCAPAATRAIRGLACCAPFAP